MFNLGIMAPQRRKNKFKPEYEAIKWIKQSKMGENYFHCGLCKCDVSLANSGKTDVDNHLNSAKHKNHFTAATSSKTMNNYMPNLSVPSPINDKAAAAEGTWAYHKAIHAHSFASTDCESGLFKDIFPDSKIAMKYSSAQTKTAAIIKGS